MIASVEVTLESCILAPAHQSPDILFSKMGASCSGWNNFLKDFPGVNAHVPNNKTLNLIIELKI